jgi:glycosyltransferase involved in cell wall biosynthesis
MISVIIPAYNESKSIGKVVETVQEILNENQINNFEILVIDDGSSDDTGNKAEESSAKVIKHPHNAGYGHSLKTGIMSASNDTIVIIDADLTYPVNAIPELIRKYHEGFDMVVGARTGKYYRESIMKSLLRIILKFLVEFTAGRSIPDINSGLRVLSKKTITNYLQHLCNTFSFTTSLTLAYMMTGKFVEYIPIEYGKRMGVSKVRLFRESLRTLQYITQSIIYYNPLKLFILLGGLCFMLSVLAFSITLFLNINLLYYVGIGGVFSSLIIFCLGLLSDLLKQIMDK